MLFDVFPITLLRTAFKCTISILLSFGDQQIRSDGFSRYATLLIIWKLDERKNGVYIKGPRNEKESFRLEKLSRTDFLKS